MKGRERSLDPDAVGKPGVEPVLDVRDRSLEQGQEVPREALGRRREELVGVVLDEALELLRRSLEGEREVEAEREALVEGVVRFELLAREAARRRLQDSPEIAELAKRMMVDRLLVIWLKGHLEHAKAVVLEKDLVMLRRGDDGIQRRISWWVQPRWK